MNINIVLLYHTYTLVGRSGVEGGSHRAVLIWSTHWKFLFKSNAKWHGKFWHATIPQSNFFILGRMPKRIELIPCITIFWLTVHLEKEYSGHHTLWNSLKYDSPSPDPRFTCLPDANILMDTWSINNPTGHMSII